MPNTTVLLVATKRWFASARIAMTLARSGCRVTTCALSGHPFEKNGVVAVNFPFDALTPAQSVLKALQNERPDLIVACDERATTILHRLYQSPDSDPAKAPGVRELIARSLGDPRSFDAACSRTKVMERARALGIHTPVGQRIGSQAEMKAWFSEHGFPAYIKADGTSGGVGVRCVESLPAASAAYRKLHAPPPLAKVLKRLLVDRDPLLVLPFFTREHPEISVQRAIRGREATCATACWQGEVLSTLSMEVLQRTEDRGPASVLRQVDNPAMTRAAELLAKEFRLTGLIGLDFILEEDTGIPYLLELNLRATQTAHLCLGPKLAPAYALGAKLQGLGHSHLPVEPRREVALFPQEWLRDPKSRYLSSSFHDIPLEAPELVRAALSQRGHRLRRATAEECVRAVQESSTVQAPHIAA